MWRRVFPCAVALTGAALQLVCWSAAYGFDVQRLQREEFQRHYAVGGSLLDLAASAIFQLGWVCGALCVCRIRTRGFRLSIAMLLVASIAAVVKVVMLLTVPSSAGDDASGSGAQIREARRHDASLAMATLAIIVPASEAAFLRRLRNSVSSRSKHRQPRQSGGGFARLGRDKDTFSVTDSLPVREHEEDVSDGGDKEAVSTAEQQRWLRGASRMASRDASRSSHASANSHSMQTSDRDLSGSIGRGVEDDVKADTADRTLVEAETNLEGKREAKRLRSSKSGKREGRDKADTTAGLEDMQRGRSRSNSASKSSSKRSKRAKEGNERKRDRNRDDSAGVTDPTKASALRRSADFLATPGRPKKDRSSRLSGKVAAGVLDSSIPVDDSKRQPNERKKLPKEYTTLVSAWAAGMELERRNSTGAAFRGGSGSGGDGGEVLLIGLSELRALISAAFDAVTGTEGWEKRSNDALESINTRHRTELLTSTISLVERAVRSKSITTAAKKGCATVLLEERMLPVGFPHAFVGQLALCLEHCFENRRMQRKVKKTIDKASRRSKMPLEPVGGCPPPPPPAAAAQPTGRPPVTLQDRSVEQAGVTGSDHQTVPSVGHRKYGGIALPGFEHRLAAAEATAPPRGAGDGDSMSQSDLRSLREQVRAHSF